MNDVLHPQNCQVESQGNPKPLFSGGLRGVQLTLSPEASLQLCCLALERVPLMMTLPATIINIPNVVSVSTKGVVNVVNVRVRRGGEGTGEGKGLYHRVCLWLRDLVHELVSNTRNRSY